MEIEPKIKSSIVNEPKTRISVAKKWMERGRPYTFPIMVIGSTVVGLIVVVMVIKDQQKPIEIREGDRTLVKVPELIPSQSPEEVMRRNGPMVSSGKRTSRQIFFGPEVVMRNLKTIPPGSFFTARLLTGASNGPVRAEAVEPLSFNGERYFDSGTLLLGNGSSGDDRLLIRFDRIVKRDGTVLQLDAQVFDRDDKLPGLKGNRISSEATKLGTGIGLNFVGGMTDALQDTTVQGGVPIRTNSVRNAFLRGASAAALDEAKDLISHARDKAPVIEVEAGRLIWIMTE